MREGLALVQQALLEADVSYSVVKDFMAHVTEQAIGEKVLASLNPSQQLVGIVHQELDQPDGPGRSLAASEAGPDVLMMCGLQGSGKTTTCGKLARMIHAARPQADAGGGRLAASRGHPPVAGARRAIGRAGLCRAGLDKTPWPFARTPSSRPASRRAGA